MCVCVCSNFETFLKDTGPMHIEDPQLVRELASLDVAMQEQIAEAGGIGKYLTQSLNFYLTEGFICNIQDMAVARQLAAETTAANRDALMKSLSMMNGSNISSKSNISPAKNLSPATTLASAAEPNVMKGTDNTATSSSTATAVSSPPGPTTALKNAIKEALKESSTTVPNVDDLGDEDCLTETFPYTTDKHDSGTGSGPDATGKTSPDSYDGSDDVTGDAVLQKTGDDTEDDDELYASLPGEEDIPEDDDSLPDVEGVDGSFDTGSVVSPEEYYSDAGMSGDDEVCALYHAWV